MDTPFPLVFEPFYMPTKNKVIKVYVCAFLVQLGEAVHVKEGFLAALGNVGIKSSAKERCLRRSSEDIEDMDLSLLW